MSRLKKCFQWISKEIKKTWSNSWQVERLVGGDSNEPNKLMMEKKNKNLRTFAQHLTKRYGDVGSEGRINFEMKAKSFAIGELIKEERKLETVLAKG